MPARVVSEWLTSCSGCEIAILNLGETLLDLIPEKISLVHIPALVDSKYFGPLGDGKKLELPEAEVGLISGSIRNEEQDEIAREMREKCNVLISLGTCATHGGIPAQSNAYSDVDLTEKVFRDCVSSIPAGDPTETVPELWSKVFAVDEVVKVDVAIPGCPPHPDWIADALLALLAGEITWKLPERSVCDTCPTVRERKAGSNGGQVKRSLSAVELYPEENDGNMRCLMEQGFLCMGPVTLAGCAGKTGHPRCITANMPCRGCFGPIRRTANPMVDMINALSTVGFDISSVPDRKLMFNRFIGAHGNLRVAETVREKGDK